jgi:hypothetical protein
MVPRNDQAALRRLMFTVRILHPGALGLVERCRLVERLMNLA